MTEKQKLLLQLFREVDAICKKHDLRYVMAGGTLIGVLRNEGFIPWDDDVDIYMPKSDWDKFVEICQNEMPPNRAVYCAEVDRNYTNGLPRSEQPIHLPQPTKKTKEKTTQERS